MNDAMLLPSVFSVVCVLGRGLGKEMERRWPEKRETRCDMSSGRRVLRLAESESTTSQIFSGNFYTQIAGFNCVWVTGFSREGFLFKCYYFAVTDPFG